MIGRQQTGGRGGTVYHMKGWFTCNPNRELHETCSPSFTSHSQDVKIRNRNFLQCTKVNRWTIKDGRQYSFYTRSTRKLRPKSDPGRSDLGLTVFTIYLVNWGSDFVSTGSTEHLGTHSLFTSNGHSDFTHQQMYSSHQ